MVWPNVADVVYVRRVRTASWASVVKIAAYVRGRQQIVEHVGSAHTEAELGVLLERARAASGPALGALDFGVEPTPAVKSLMRCLESGDPVDGGLEQDPVAQLCGPQHRPGGEVGFSRTRWAKQDDVGCFGEEGAGGQCAMVSRLGPGW